MNPTFYRKNRRTIRIFLISPGFADPLVNSLLSDRGVQKREEALYRVAPRMALLGGRLRLLRGRPLRFGILSCLSGGPVEMYKNYKGVGVVATPHGVLPRDSH